MKRAQKRNWITWMGGAAIALGIVFSVTATGAVQPEAAVCREAVDRDGVFRVCRGGFVDHRPSGTRITPTQFGRNNVFVSLRGLDKYGAWINAGSYVDFNIDGTDDILRITFHRQYKSTDADLEFEVNPSYSKDEDSQGTITPRVSDTCGNHTVNNEEVLLCNNARITHKASDISLRVTDREGIFVELSTTGALQPSIWARAGEAVTIYKNNDINKQLFVRVDNISDIGNVKLTLRSSGVEVLGTQVTRDDDDDEPTNTAASCAANVVTAGYNTFCEKDEFVIAGTGVVINVREVGLKGMHIDYTDRGVKKNAFIPPGSNLQMLGDANKQVTLTFEGIRTGRIGGAQIDVVTAPKVAVRGTQVVRGDMCNLSGNPILTYTGTELLNAKVGYTFNRLTQPYELSMLAATGDVFKAISINAPACGSDGQKADGVYLWPEPWSTWGNKSTVEKEQWCRANVSCSREIDGKQTRREVTISGGSCYCPGLY